MSPLTLWRSLDELEGRTPAEPDGPDPGFSRREFLTVLGLAGVAGCFQEPPEKVVPYMRKPTDVTPGVPLHYATAVASDGDAVGLLVTCYEGRPTKIEGNPDHPMSLGATGAIEQALLQQLYDPDRATTIKEVGQPRAWLSFQRFALAAAERLRANGGAGLHFLSEPDASPLLAALQGRIAQTFPNARFWSWSPLADDQALEGARLAFGRPLVPRYAMEKADVIVSLDADFLERGPGWLANARAFASRRVPEAGLNRLYVVETAMSATGAMADHRLRVRGAEVETVAAALAAQVTGRIRAGAPDKWVKAVAADLSRARGRSLVLAGRRQPAIVHALAHAMNAALGNVGQTVTYLPAAVEPSRLPELCNEMRAGRVDTLVITAWNPVYSAPADLELGKLLQQVKTSIYSGLYEDETAAAATWFIPAAHALESWGDTRAHDGTVALRQPLITPLHGGLTTAEIWAAFLGEGGKGSHNLLRETWNGKIDFDRALQLGVVREKPPVPETPPVRWEAITPQPAPQPGGIEVNFLPCPKVWDGRYGNVGWLQELPDPMTKITWDNALLVSPRTAARLDLELGQMVRVEVGGRSLEAPVYLSPGHADDAVSIALGYGRTSPAERSARGVGANAYALRTSNAPWFVGGARLVRLDRKHRFAITQDHGGQHDRALALSETAKDFKPEHLEDHREPLPTMYPAYEYRGYRWAMAIDLGRCTGCSACVVACEAENNSPVVGKERVARGREMQWLRIDRYYSGSPDDPSVITQPIMCVHCENAPCEYVCPVNATVHSDEGLNEMVYNRCVGTRYCSNNCPYKVRRFNYFDYMHERPHLFRMLANPDVTIRGRGVMEKCTYCVQRIERARIDARIAGRKINDQEFTTACAQVCPTQAITFGSLSDPEAQVTKLHGDPRHYFLLHDLGTRPRTTHLLRLKNPNPELG